jgi:hypothetical integral membrane protein (TIGR02206 family)
MKHGSSEHWIIIFLTVVMSVYVAHVGRHDETGRRSRRLAWFLGIGMIVNYALYVFYRVKEGYWEIRYDLPMEFCNWSAIATSMALLTRNRLAAELSYFWVITGSINGLITPDLDSGFPHLRFFMFFTGHCGLIVACTFAIFGLRMYPRRGAVLRAFLFSELYLIVTLAVNLLVNGNYGYLMAKPTAGSLLDYLGAWPGYLIHLQWIILLLFGLAYLPFYRMYSRQTVQ